MMPEKADQRTQRGSSDTASDTTSGPETLHLCSAFRAQEVELTVAYLVVADSTYVGNACTEDRHGSVGLVTPAVIN